MQESKKANICLHNVMEWKYKSAAVGLLAYLMSASEQMSPIDGKHPYVNQEARICFSFK